jgi:hypothetical protein
MNEWWNTAGLSTWMHRDGRGCLKHPEEDAYYWLPLPAMGQTPILCQRYHGVIDDQINYIHVGRNGHTEVGFSNKTKACSCGVERKETPNLRIGFWDRLGYDESWMPKHFPIGLTEDGQGPTNDSEARHWGCWCGEQECALDQVLRVASESKVKVCDQEHGAKDNAATVYGHFGSPRTCIRIKGTDQWVYDPAWEQ